MIQVSNSPMKAYYDGEEGFNADAGPEDVVFAILDGTTVLNVLTTAPTTVPQGASVHALVVR